MKLVNLTPHEIVIQPYPEQPNIEVRIPVTGRVARVTKTDSRTRITEIDGVDVPVVEAAEPSGVVGLPDEPEPNTLYIVSFVVFDYARVNKLPIYRALAMPDTSPASVVRDSAGRIIAVRRLVVSPDFFANA